MRSVFVLCDRVGATQHISFTQPLTQAIDAEPVRLHLDRPPKFRKDLFAAFANAAPDVLVLSRLTSTKIAELVHRARASGVPIIFHIDDDLLNVPETLGSHKFGIYNDPERLAGLRANIEASDLLYASTSALGERLRAYEFGVPILAGDIYCSVDPRKLRDPLPSLTPVIGYMGSEGHAGDLAMVTPAIAQLMEEIPDLRFETYGTIRSPEALARFGGRIGHHRPTGNYAEFLAKLQSLGWWIGLAPLEDSAFNLCKADTKWVEYSYAGVATVASAVAVYDRACSGGAGIQVGDDLDAWRDAMRALVTQPDRRVQMIEAARSKLGGAYSHDRLRRQLSEVFAVASQRRRS